MKHVQKLISGHGIEESKCPAHARVLSLLRRRAKIVGRKEAKKIRLSETGPDGRLMRSRLRVHAAASEASEWSIQMMIVVLHTF